ncbi:TadE/TadG family type IV pilus assembly protein [Massilia sp. SYSU DXS3249]
MKPAKTRFFRRTESGSIAVETIFCLPLLILFLVVPLFLARAFWYYSVAQKAAHDGARFLANATLTEIVAPDGSGGDPLPVALIAEAIAHAELDEIKPALARYTVSVLCDGEVCGNAVPQRVRVSVQLRFRDQIFDTFTSKYFGDDPIILTGRVTMRYVGN